MTNTIYRSFDWTRPARVCVWRHANLCRLRFASSIYYTFIDNRIIIRFEGDKNLSPIGILFFVWLRVSITDNDIWPTKRCVIAFAYADRNTQFSSTINFFQCDKFHCSLWTSRVSLDTTPYDSGFGQCHQSISTAVKMTKQDREREKQWIRNSKQPKVTKYAVELIDFVHCSHRSSLLIVRVCRADGHMCAWSVI